MRTKSQVSLDGARREAALLELDTEGHTVLGQHGCCLGRPLLVPALDGLGQAPRQLFCKEMEHIIQLSTSPKAPSPLWPPAFTFLHQVSRTRRGNVRLGLGGLGCAHFRRAGWGDRACLWAQGWKQAVTA